MSAVLSAPPEGDFFSPRADSAAAVSSALAELTASDRLALSRERLRSAMLASRKAKGAASNGPGGAASAAWLGTLKTIPGAGIVIEALSGWWAQHPLRLASRVAADAAKAAFQPLAQRHPLVLMLGALLLGGVLARRLPWRWLLKPALLAGLAPQLLSKAMAQVPASSWMAALSSLAKAQPTSPHTPAR